MSDVVMRVKDRAAVPKGGYQYTENGHGFSARSLGQVYHKVKKYREANHLALDGLAAAIEDQICENRPELCVDEETYKPSILRMASNFATSMKVWAESGFAMVDETEFNRRVEICQNCNHWRGFQNAGIGYCSKCGCPAGRVTLKLWMKTEKCPLKEPKW